MKTVQRVLEVCYKEQDTTLILTKMFFAVTCGRGLEKHVLLEIKEKLRNLENTFELTEGKLCFSVKSLLKLDIDYKIKLEEKDNTMEYFTYNARMNDKDVIIDHHIKEMLPTLFNLKLIERLFVMIFYQNSNQEEKNYKLSSKFISFLIYSLIFCKFPPFL